MTGLKFKSLLLVALIGVGIYASSEAIGAGLRHAASHQLARTSSTGSLVLVPDPRGILVTSTIPGALWNETVIKLTYGAHYALNGKPDKRSPESNALARFNGPGPIREGDVIGFCGPWHTDITIVYVPQILTVYRGYLNGVSNCEGAP